ncbi:MAG: lipid A biosynthesis acyltransferase [Sterolibacterium sp.]|nr:lipid A biosynthesis acyltransferase [Sterolibacterium sp.]MBP9799252.1 lipid A biosynthesis acyltransferase [Sterolibacterium sp.]
MITRLALILMWLLHFLPLTLLTRLGHGLGALLYRLGRDRRQVTLTNLRLCFPQKTEEERIALARRHFAAFGRSFIERGLLWWASPTRLRRIVRIEGIEHIDAHIGRPIILLVPHFIGLDMGWTRLTLERDMVSIYANQKNLLFNAALYKGRTRFGDSRLLSRQEGTRPALRAMRDGLPFYYLPDMDYGERDTIFVPFFGVPAATITGLSRLARLAQAVVIPVITHMLPDDQGYVVRISDAWATFPGPSIEEDTQRMNRFIEEEVLQLPEQYFWLHKRFKTRPPGDPSPYK